MAREFCAQDLKRIRRKIHKTRNRADAAFQNNRFEEALVGYCRGIFLLSLPCFSQSEERVAAFLWRRSRVLIELGEFDEAVHDAEHSITLNPLVIEAYEYGGLASERMGDLHRAMKMFAEGMLKGKHYNGCDINKQAKCKFLEKIALMANQIKDQKQFDWAVEKLVNMEAFEVIYRGVMQGKVVNDCKFCPQLSLTSLAKFTFRHSSQWGIDLLLHFLKNGVRVENMADEDSDVLHLALRICMKTRKFELMEFLFSTYSKTRESRHAVDRKGNTLLHLACSQPGVKHDTRDTAVNFLLKYKLPCDVVNHNGKKAFEYLKRNDPLRKQIEDQCPHEMGTRDKSREEKLQEVASNVGSSNGVDPKSVTKLAKPSEDHRYPNDEISSPLVKGLRNSTISAEERLTPLPESAKRPYWCEKCAHIFEEGVQRRSNGQTTDALNAFCQILNKNEHDENDHEDMFNESLEHVCQIIQMEGKQKEVLPIIKEIILRLEEKYIKTLIKTMATRNYWHVSCLILEWCKSNLKEMQASEDGQAVSENCAAGVCLWSYIKSDYSLKSTEQRCKHLKLLLEFGASSNGIHRGRIPLHAALGYETIRSEIASRPDYQAARILLEGSSNIQDCDGNPGLHAVLAVALSAGNADMLKYLLEETKLDPYTVNLDGDTMLHVAMKAKMSDTAISVVKLLCPDHLPYDVCNSMHRPAIDCIMKRNDGRVRYLQSVAAGEMKKCKKQLNVYIGELEQAPYVPNQKVVIEENAQSIGSRPGYVSSVEVNEWSCMSNCCSDDKDTYSTEFENAPFEIICTQDVMKILKSPKVSTKMKDMISKKLLRLASGEQGKGLKKRVHKKYKSLFEAKISDSARIIWQDAIAFSPRHTGEKRVATYCQVIRVWDIVFQHDKIHHCVERIVQSLDRGNETKKKKVPTATLR